MKSLDTLFRAIRGTEHYIQPQVAHRETLENQRWIESLAEGAAVFFTAAAWGFANKEKWKWTTRGAVFEAVLVKIGEHHRDSAAQQIYRQDSWGITWLDAVRQALDPHSSIERDRTAGRAYEATKNVFHARKKREATDKGFYHGLPTEEYLKARQELCGCLTGFGCEKCDGLGSREWMVAKIEQLTNEHNELANETRHLSSIVEEVTNERDNQTDAHVKLREAFELLNEAYERLKKEKSAANEEDGAAATT